MSGFWNSPSKRMLRNYGVGVIPGGKIDILDNPLLKPSLVSQGCLDLSGPFDDAGKSSRPSPCSSQANKSGPFPLRDSGMLNSFWPLSRPQMKDRYSYKRLGAKQMGNLL